METEQSSGNQNSMGTEIQSQRGSSSNFKLLVIVLVSVLLTAIVVSLTVMKDTKVSPPVLSPVPIQSAKQISPTPQPVDNQPPRGGISGVDEGSVISTTLSYPFCTKSLGHDNVTETQKLFMRNKLNGEEWSSWSLSYERCWQYLGNGEYTYFVQFKDEAGNESEIISKTFTVKNTD